MTGCIPALTYAGEVDVAPRAMIRQVRQQALVTSGLYIPGGHAGVLASMEKPGWDPAVRLDWAPIQKWCEEIWWHHAEHKPLDLIPIRRLATSWQESRINMANLIEQRELRICKWPQGPMAGLFHSLVRVGWTMTSPFAIQTSHGMVDLWFCSASLLNK